MTDATLTRLQEVFRDVFDDDELSITRDTTAHDIDDWDSLMHVSLIVAAEERFVCRFSSADVAALESVGQLVDLIERAKAG